MPRRRRRWRTTSRGDARFGTFAAALRATGFADPAGVGTVFAPTDEAFDRVGEGLLGRLDDPGMEGVLRDVVALHLVPEERHASDDLPVEMGTLADGLRLVVTYTLGTLTLRPAPVDAAASADAALAARAATEARIGDVEAGGRLVHGIDMVMLPPDLDARIAAAEAAQAVQPAPVTTESAPAAATAPAATAVPAPAPAPAQASGDGVTTIISTPQDRAAPQRAGAEDRARGGRAADHVDGPDRAHRARPPGPRGASVRGRARCRSSGRDRWRRGPGSA